MARADNAQLILILVKGLKQVIHLRARQAKDGINTVGDQTFCYCTAGIHLGHMVSLNIIITRQLV